MTWPILATVAVAFRVSEPSLSSVSVSWLNCTRPSSSENEPRSAESDGVLPFTGMFAVRVTDLNTGSVATPETASPAASSVTRSCVSVNPPSVKLFSGRLRLKSLASLIVPVRSSGFGPSKEFEISPENLIPAWVKMTVGLLSVNPPRLRLLGNSALMLK